MGWWVWIWADVHRNLCHQLHSHQICHCPSPDHPQTSCHLKVVSPLCVHYLTRLRRSTVLLSQLGIWCALGVNPKDRTISKRSNIRSMSVMDHVSHCQLMYASVVVLSGTTKTCFPCQKGRSPWSAQMTAWSSSVLTERHFS